MPTQEVTLASPLIIQRSTQRGIYLTAKNRSEHKLKCYLQSIEKVVAILGL
jgi:hypothetical protein